MACAMRLRCNCMHGSSPVFCSNISDYQHCHQRTSWQNFASHDGPKKGPETRSSKSSTRFRTQPKFCTSAAMGWYRTLLLYYSSTKAKNKRGSSGISVSMTIDICDCILSQVCWPMAAACTWCFWSAWRVRFFISFKIESLTWAVLRIFELTWTMQTFYGLHPFVHSLIQNDTSLG